MSKSLEDFRKEVLSDKQSEAIYESLHSEFKIHSELVRARLESGFSPDDVVEGTGMSRENIAKLEGAYLDESAQLNLIHLQKYIDFIHYKMEFKLIPKN